MEARVRSVEQPFPATERRIAPRHCLAPWDLVVGRIRPGYSAVIVNLSSAGALVETACRLLPGSWIELRLDRNDAPVSTRAKVARCTVVGISEAGLVYRGGVRFDQLLPSVVSAASSAKWRSPESSRDSADGADATRSEGIT